MKSFGSTNVSTVSVFASILLLSSFNPIDGKNIRQIDGDDGAHRKRGLNAEDEEEWGKPVGRTEKRGYNPYGYDDSQDYDGHTKSQTKSYSSYYQHTTKPPRTYPPSQQDVNTHSKNSYTYNVNYDVDLNYANVDSNGYGHSGEDLKLAIGDAVGGYDSPPSYIDNTYSAPSYIDNTYSEPSYTDNTYSAPSYSAPSYASGSTYSDGAHYTPPSGQCVTNSLETCLGSQASCEAYGHFSKKACPALSYGSYGYDNGVDKFLCPCRDTLKSYFDKVTTQKCAQGHYFYDTHYSCKDCDDECLFGYGDSLAGGGYRKLEEGDDESEEEVGYNPAYVHGAGYNLQQCSCLQIEYAAIVKFCVDFVGLDFLSGYGGGYRKLDDEVAYKTYDGYVAPDYCDYCVKDCVDYVSNCCTYEGSVCSNVGY